MVRWFGINYLCVYIMRVLVSVYVCEYDVCVCVCVCVCVSECILVCMCCVCVVCVCCVCAIAGYLPSVASMPCYTVLVSFKPASS